MSSERDKPKAFAMRARVFTDGAFLDPSILHSCADVILSFFASSLCLRFFAFLRAFIFMPKVFIVLSRLLILYHKPVAEINRFGKKLLMSRIDKKIKIWYNVPRQGERIT